MLYYFSPLLNGIVMGIVFAYVAKPIKSRIALGNRAASLIATTLIILPVSFLMFYGMFQGLNQLVYLLTHQRETELMLVKVLKGLNLPEKYVSYIVSYLPVVEKVAKEHLRVSAINVTVKAVMFFMNFLISAIVCFYALSDGRKFVDAAVSVLLFMNVIPENLAVEDLLREIDNTLVSLWFGNFAFAVLIGLVSIPYFLAFNVPYVPMLSGLMFLAALIPVFAEWMVILPVTAFIAVNSVTSAIWFLIIGVVFLYILPEIVLRPHFVGYASEIHPLLLLLAFIGGAIAGGASGFFIAPMLVAIATAVYNYRKSLDFEVKEEL